MQKDDTWSIRNRVIDLIQSHPEYALLRNTLMQPGLHSIWGINEGIEDLLLKALERSLQYVFIYSLNPLIAKDDIDFLFFEKNEKEWGMHAVEKKLFDLKYKKVERIANSGEYSVKGGIIDIFGKDYVTRLDYFGDEIENIFLIDPLTGSIEYNIDFAFVPKAGTDLSLSSYDLAVHTQSIILFNHRSDQHVYHFDFEPMPFVFSNTRLMEYELKKRENQKVIIASHNTDYIEKFK